MFAFINGQKPIAARLEARFAPMTVRASAIVDPEPELLEAAILLALEPTRREAEAFQLELDEQLRRAGLLHRMIEIALERDANAQGNEREAPHVSIPDASEKCVLGQM